MKIVAGLGSIDEYERFVKAGADEFFCGYVPYSSSIGPHGKAARAARQFAEPSLQGARRGSAQCEQSTAVKSS